MGLRSWFHRFKSAITGRYVQRDEAQAQPATTYEESRVKDPEPEPEPTPPARPPRKKRAARAKPTKR